MLIGILVEKLFYFRDENFNGSISLTPKAVKDLSSNYCITKRFTVRYLHSIIITLLIISIHILVHKIYSKLNLDKQSKLQLRDHPIYIFYAKCFSVVKCLLIAKSLTLTIFWAFFIYAACFCNIYEYLELLDALMRIIFEKIKLDIKHRNL